MRIDNRRAGARTRARFVCLAALFFGLFPPLAKAAVMTITFENFPNGDPIPDSTPLSSQFPGLMFTNATVITADVTLFKEEFPPHSGQNVAFDDGGPILISFAPQISSFAGFFTYSSPLMIDAYGPGGALIASVNSQFSSNIGDGGEPGSAPNEFLSIASMDPISSITIIADPMGDSFTMDDITFDTVVPEPRFTFLVAFAVAAFGLMRYRRCLRMLVMSAAIVSPFLGILSAQPPGSPEVSPKFVIQDKSTPVMVISRIANPDVDPASILIQSVDGKTVTPIGKMNNGGSGLIFTGMVNVTVPAGKQMLLRVSAGVRGKPARIFCGDVPVTAVDAFVTGFSKTGIQNFINAKNITTSADFLKRLPPADFKQDWILMSASDSLQTGNATTPRVIIQTGKDSKQVFGFSLDKNEFEYMQFDEADKINQFRFFLIHDKMVDENANGATADSLRCSNCHFGKRDLSWPYPRPNWDAYDSWGGALPYNRDRIYESSTEETAIKNLLKNLKGDAIVSQLDLPPGITRECNGDVVITYPGAPFVDSGAGGRMTGVKFTDAFPPSYPGAANVNVMQGKQYLTMKSTSTDRLAVDEGRGVALFDHLTKLNASRVAQEIVGYSAAVGQKLDIRPAAFAIANACAIDGTNLGDYATSDALKQFLGVTDPADFPKAFQMLVDDTEARRHGLPQLKANQQAGNIAALMTQYGGAQTGASVTQEVARRSLFGQPSLAGPAEFRKDTITGFMIDRELYDADDNSSTRLALFRLFLQTGGEPVRRWTMSIKGEAETHMNTYTFGDLFSMYIGTLKQVLGEEMALNADGTAVGKKFKDLNCNDLAQLSKAWIDKAFKADATFFGAP